MHDITDDFFKWIAIKPQIQQTTHHRGCEYNIRRPDFTEYLFETSAVTIPYFTYVC